MTTPRKKPGVAFWIHGFVMLVQLAPDDETYCAAMRRFVAFVDRLIAAIF